MLRIFKVVALCLALFLFVYPEISWSQDKSSPLKYEKKSGVWTVYCEKEKDNDHNRCAIIQKNRSSNNTFIWVNVIGEMKEDRFQLTIRTNPRNDGAITDKDWLGIHFLTRINLQQYGVLTDDDRSGIRFEWKQYGSLYTKCGKKFCESKWITTAEVLEKLLASKKIFITATLTEKEGFGMTITLSGLREGLEDLQSRIK
jgi:invasion protein IalB